MTQELCWHYAAAMRDIPAAAEFAQEIARHVAGQACVLDEGDYPSFAIEVDGQRALLLRDHQYTLALSLPEGPQWHLVTRADWDAARDLVRAAVAHYRAEHPTAVSMADAVLALRPLVWHLTAERTTVSFPGTPVPSECWIEAGKARVGVFQMDHTARVVIWVDQQARSLELASGSDLARLPSWARPALLAQLEHATATLPEKPPPLPPPPSLAEVLARLERGLGVRVGGARYNVTYYIRDCQLRCRTFDEGYDTDEAIDPAHLAAAIQSNPEEFGRAVSMGGA